MEKIFVGKTNEISEENPKTVEGSGTQIAVFNVSGKFYAIENNCPHQGGPLAEGAVAGETVTCPLHAWEFDIKTGESTSNPGAKTRKFNVIIENDEVYVEV